MKPQKGYFHLDTHVKGQILDLRKSLSSGFNRVMMCEEIAPKPVASLLQMQ
jgi:hypothetical protein